MEIKIMFEIEKNSRETLDKLSGALEKISKRDLIPDAILKHINGGVINPKNHEEMYVEQAKKEVPASVVETSTVEHEPGATDMLPVSDEVPKATTPTYTDEQLAAACVEASRLGLGSQVRELIRGTYKVSKVSEIPDGLRDGFIGDLRGVGVRI